MIKVCHLTSVHPRYDTRIFFKECISLARMHYDVTLIVADGKGHEKKDGVRILDAGVSRFGRAGRMTRTVMAVYRKALSVKAHIYHLHDPELIPAALLLKAQGKKIIYDVHEDYSEAIFYKQWLPPRMRRFVATLTDSVEKAVASCFDSIISVTYRIGQRFRSNNRNVVVVQNFPILDEVFDAESMLPWNDRENIMAFVGSISLIRGIREMFEALDLIPHRLNIHLILAGYFSPKSLEKDIQCMPGWNRCEYLGYVRLSDIAKLLGRAKIGLVLTHPVSNLRNGQPVKLFEYMAAGIPVVASNFPLWRKIIEESGCGICVNPLDPIEIADVIIRLLDNQKEAERMGLRGRRAVQERYNWDREEEKLSKLYSELI